MPGNTNNAPDPFSRFGHDLDLHMNTVYRTTRFYGVAYGLFIFVSVVYKAALALNDLDETYYQSLGYRPYFNKDTRSRGPDITNVQNELYICRDGNHYRPSIFFKDYPANSNPKIKFQSCSKIEDMPHYLVSDFIGGITPIVCKTALAVSMIDIGRRHRRLRSRISMLLISVMCFLVMNDNLNSLLHLIDPGPIRSGSNNMNFQPN
jgi:hypothetical protein